MKTILKQSNVTLRILRHGLITFVHKKLKLNNLKIVTGKNLLDKH